MKCDACKTKEATVHLTEIINNKVTKLHLCEECAREKSHEMEEHFGLADLLSGLTELIPPPPSGEKKGAPEVTVKCPSCGFTFQNFRKMGRLGCPACYGTFEEQLSPLLKKIHGTDTHTGKMPVKKEVTRGKADTASDLKEKLEKAIRLEEFEKAAALRDKIRAIEKKKKK